MAILALVSDLMMQSQLSGAAQRTGATLTIVANEAVLLAAVQAEPPTLLIVDLAHPGVNPQTLMAQLADVLPAECTTLAFGPHVHKELLAAAATAGFRHVLARGQFHANMDTILASANVC